MSSLKLSNIYKTFPNGKKAVGGLSIEMPDKEFLVVVGPSGCGKTTLLRLIAGLETPTSGEIYMDGEVVNSLKPKDRSVTLVFQNYALFPYMTARENIAFGLKVSGMKKEEIDKKVSEAAAMLGITNDLDCKPRELSGGQRQRVALGRAMVVSPKFFLLDEPLSNLDAKLRAEMRMEITELYEKLDATFIYVTHDQTEAMTMGTRIAVVSEGIVQQIDTPANIYNRPANKFVASFIGSPEMNFFDGILTKCADGVRLSALGVDINLPTEMFDGVNGDYLNGNCVVTVGIRPEDIIVSPETENIATTVNNVEAIGRDLIVYTKFGKDQITVKTTMPIKKGDNITIGLDKSKLHFFAPSGGNIR